jgi:hypothetical protein
MFFLPARAFFFPLAYLVLRLSAYRIQLGTHFINQWPSLSSFVCHHTHGLYPIGLPGYHMGIRLYLPPRMTPRDALVRKVNWRISWLSFVAFLFQAIEPRWQLC